MLFQQQGRKKGSRRQHDGYYDGSQCAGQYRFPTGDRPDGRQCPEKVVATVCSNLHINPGNGIFNMYGDYTLIERQFSFLIAEYHY